MALPYDYQLELAEHGHLGKKSRTNQLGGLSECLVKSKSDESSRQGSTYSLPDQELRALSVGYAAPGDVDNCEKLEIASCSRKREGSLFHDLHNQQDEIDQPARKRRVDLTLSLSPLPLEHPDAASRSIMRISDASVGARRVANCRFSLKPVLISRFQRCSRSIFCHRSAPRRPTSFFRTAC